MKLVKKVIGIFVGFSLIFLPPVSEAKQHKKVQKISKKIEKHKKISKKTQKHKKISKKTIKFSKHNKFKVKKVSYYNPGPIVYGDHLEPKEDIYKYAIGLLGTKYSFGGTSINGIDCSSFVQHVFGLAGLKLPRTAREQARYGYFISKDNIKPGDLLFFATYAKYPSHVGIYIGNGKMIHASSKGRKVEITDINQGYYQKRFLFAKRIPDNIEDLKEVEDVDIMQGNITTNEENEKESDVIAKIIKEKDGKN